MLKYLLLAVLAGFVWLAWKKSQQRSVAQPPAERPVESMVTCAHCGVHLPASDALRADEFYYCTPAHRQAGPGAGRR